MKNLDSGRDRGVVAEVASIASELRSNLGSSRVMIGIAGPPGVGKSTFTEALANELGPVCAVVPMDGFHLSNDVLTEKGMRGEKGAPHTFDALGYGAILERIKKDDGSTVFAPVFDRDLEQAIASAIEVRPEHRIILTEGNYLLLDDSMWSIARNQLDEVWYLELPRRVRRKRLVERRIGYGDSKSDAERWVDRVDMPNADVVDKTALHADRRILRPKYDRDLAKPGVVHLGLGGFHRSHQAVYFDRILESGDMDWGIVGVGAREVDRENQRGFEERSGMYTLLTVATDGTEKVQQIDSLIDYKFAPERQDEVIELIADPEIRIVTVTVTEGGYEAQDTEMGDVDAISLLADGLRARMIGGGGPIAVVSCDNLQGNGAIAKHAVLARANSLDGEFISWLNQNVSFPSSMVDRITPRPDKSLVTHLRATHRVWDSWPVRSEEFLQWVLEDRFPAGRPDLEAVGVQMVADVRPYESMKLRLLNASHQVMAHLGLLAGIDWVHQTTEDPEFQLLLETYMKREAAPTLKEVEGIDTPDYCAELMRRFSSRAVQDTLERQVADASERIRAFVVPVARDQLSMGGPVDITSLTVAAWSVLAQQRLEANEALPDQNSDLVEKAVFAERAKDGAFLDEFSFLEDLASDSRFRDAFVSWREMLIAHGARSAVSKAIRLSRTP